MAANEAGESGRTIAFVDAVGGALSALAVGVAEALGVSAVAATCGAVASAPAAIATVLEEVGMRAPSAEVRELGAVDQEAVEIVFLGSSAPKELEGAPRLDVALIEGPGDLERLSSARIVRDRIERRLAGARGDRRV